MSYPRKKNMTINGFLVSGGDFKKVSVNLENHTRNSKVAMTDFSNVTMKIFFQYCTCF
jgi:hypothetical protein